MVQEMWFNNVSYLELWPTLYSAELNHFEEMRNSGLTGDVILKISYVEL